MHTCGLVRPRYSTEDVVGLRQVLATVPSLLRTSYRAQRLLMISFKIEIDRKGWPLQLQLELLAVDGVLWPLCESKER